MLTTLELEGPCRYPYRLHVADETPRKEERIDDARRVSLLFSGNSRYMHACTVSGQLTPSSALFLSFSAQPAIWASDVDVRVRARVAQWHG